MDIEKLSLEIAKVVNIDSISLYDCVYVNENSTNILRVIIDSIKGVELDDCVKVSSLVSELLDKLDPIEEGYSLEVTSPGAERVLKTDEEIRRFIGFYAYVETLEQKCFGFIESFNNGELKIKEKTKNRIQLFNIIDVELIRLAIEF